ncbi:MAG: DUF4430 domain-containing protein [Streptococcaceae bacterium]|jgi:heptaprenylglyceryl phosphate synthase|nr:DUF4430 domain-containing protein [Streptococcaceae bacterium]
MKSLKKLSLLLLFAILSMGLVACSNISVTKESSTKNVVPTANKILVKVMIAQKSKDYTVKSETNLLTFAKNQLAANEANGLINSVAGMKSDPTNKAYLMFKLNGKVSNVGAEEVKLKEGDKIEFYISKF